MDELDPILKDCESEWIDLAFNQRDDDGFVVEYYYNDGGVSLVCKDDPMPSERECRMILGVVVAKIAVEGPSINNSTVSERFK